MIFVNFDRHAGVLVNNFPEFQARESTRMASYLTNLLGSLWSEGQPAETVYTTDDYNEVLFSEESEKRDPEVSDANMKEFPVCCK